MPFPLPRGRTFCLVAIVGRAHAAQVKILPTVICFNDGVAVHNIIGFEGLTAGLSPDKLDEWPLSSLARELALAKVCIPT